MEFTHQGEAAPPNASMPPPTAALGDPLNPPHWLTEEGEEVSPEPPLVEGPPSGLRVVGAFSWRRGKAHLSLLEALMSALSQPADSTAPFAVLLLANCEPAPWQARWQGPRGLLRKRSIHSERQKAGKEGGTEATHPPPIIHAGEQNPQNPVRSQG